jgi:hypothetical protein
MKNKETLPRQQLEKRMNVKKHAAAMRQENKKLCPMQAQFWKIASRDF